MLSMIAENLLQCNEGTGGNRVLEKPKGQHACIRGTPGESEAENLAWYSNVPPLSGRRSLRSVWSRYKPKANTANKVASLTQ
jgi:hypothetical protein